MRITASALILILAALVLLRCESKNEEDLFGQVDCDTLNVTYQESIEPILRKNCYECHAIEIATLGIILEDHENLILRVNTGQFPGAVNHRSGFTPMPKDRGKLNDCDLDKINKWLNEGAADN